MIQLSESDLLGSFPADYRDARDRFRTRIADPGWSAEAHPVDVPGHAADELTIDVASIGRPEAENLLILSSGLHGVEAPFGSAVQLAWLDTRPAGWQPPAGWRVLLLHALNPWGFVQRRRFNENNVDLNRNFIEPGDFDALRRQSEQSDYRRFDPYINPPTPPGRFDLFPLLAVWLTVRFGARRLREAVPVGQYAFPKGLFFGGPAQAASTRIIMNHAARWVGSAGRVIHLDFHTGLGKWGRFKLLGSEREDSAVLGWAANLFGADHIEGHGGPTAYANHGDMGVWLQRRFSDRPYLFLTAEFGTYGAPWVIGALRAENRAHHWGDPASIAWRRAKDRLREAFVPRSPRWRKTVLQQSLQLIRRAAPE